MTDTRWWLICYDVRDPKRLRRTAKHLEGYGERMQYSVFRVWLTPTQIERLRWELTQFLDPADDVLIIPLCPRCVQKVRVTHSSIKKQNWPQEPDGSDIV